MSTSESCQAKHYARRREDVTVSSAQPGACAGDGVTGEERIYSDAVEAGRRDTNERPAVNPPIHHRASERTASQAPQPARDNAASESIHLTAEPHLSSKPV